MVPAAYLTEAIYRYFSLISGMVAIFISPFVMYFGTGIMNFINECRGFFSMPILLAVLFGLLSKKVSAIATKVISALPVLGVLLLCGGVRHLSRLHQGCSPLVPGA